jgi:hypothetical protein
MTLHISAEGDVLRDASSRGFWLTQRTLDNGQRAWAWVDDEQRPQPWFLTRRQAIDYMSDKLNAATG